jgi:hypothetical protein
MILFDSLAEMHLPKLEFFYKSLSRFMPSDRASSVFRLAFKSLESSIPGMEKSLRLLLETKLQCFSFKISAPEAEAKENRNSTSLPSFEQSEVDAISTLLEQFKAELAKQFEPSGLQTPGFLVRKYNRETKEMNFFQSEEMVKLIGLFHDEFSPAFDSISQDFLNELLRLRVEGFINSSSTVTGFMKIKHHTNGNIVPIMYSSTHSFNQETGEFDKWVFIIHPAGDG